MEKQKSGDIKGKKEGNEETGKGKVNGVSEHAGRKKRERVEKEGKKRDGKKRGRKGGGEGKM